jgi:hypothetical protein
VTHVTFDYAGERSRCENGVGPGLAFAVSLSTPSSSSSFADAEKAQQTCTSDAFRLCSAEISNISEDDHLHDKHRFELSPGCRAVLDRDLKGRQARHGRMIRTVTPGFIAKMRCGAAAYALERRCPHARSDMKAKPMTRFLCLICFVLISSSALAQSTHEHDACARDAARFCRPVINDGDQAVLSCLQQHRHRISRACERVMAAHGQ